MHPNANQNLLPEYDFDTASALLPADAQPIGFRTFGFLCQDCGEYAPTGWGMCKRCAEYAE
ncbi:hypothetical protein [Pseudoxanthomonas sacheonensis]|uniref:hypothetical protein n=1 Tax=Pseudoxanthomonas sacheonensis TaxID=443615 RepID=UPI0013D419D8|nr:hypothetical protein [Pseudoxanthomonas sacheonensis]KAF1706258.1 hypothetical protein CSC73_16255 [Pseudoxanthomonas sacheonensis]